MKAYTKIFSLALAVQFTLAAGEKSLGDDLIARAFTVTSNTDSLVARAFTITSNTDSLVARAFTVTSNTDSLVARAFTAVSCEEGDGGLCADCDGDDIPDECELDCGFEGGPCDIPGCGQSEDCNGNGVPDECEPDCNANGVADECDIDGGTSQDCNSNEIPDECDLDPLDPDGNGQVSEDCNDNDTPDECEPDCDEDGIPDECEISDCAGEPECSDCNGNGIPDGCEPDCDEDGIPDECEIADCAGDPECSDCNGNGIPDECDLDPRDPDGDGEVSGDCNENGIPDECDIADCDGDPECGDCNVNGIPDGCDIDPADPDGNGQVSDDDDDDGVPDECIVWDGESPENDLWSTAVNWEDDEVPGDGDPDDLESVVIAGAGANVILDVNADIDSLFLDIDTTLHVTDGDLSILDPTETFEGNMLVRGDLQIGDGQSISAAGEVTIGPGGIYHADPAAKEPITATLEAGDITVLGGVVVGQLDGALVLSGSMEVTAHGDLHLNGSGIQDNDDCDDRDKGDGTPPDFNSTGNARVTVMNDFIITGSACVDQSSAEPLLLGGDFENHSIVPGIFNWAGELRMDGLAQTIEAAGEDRGPWPIGLEDNFAFGTLHLEAGTIVAMGDTFDNQQDGVIACDEALYVDTLIVSAGAVLLTDGCRVYYNELINDGAVPSLGVDVLQILEPCAADFDGDGETGAFDLAQLLGGWGPCPSPCEPEGDPAMCPESCTAEDHAQICPADLDGDCKVAAFDLAILLGSWGSCSGQPG